MVDWLLGLQDGCFHYNQWFVCSLIQHCVHFALTYSRRSKKVVIALMMTSYVVSLVTALIILATNVVTFTVSIPELVLFWYTNTITKTNTKA